MIEGSVTTSKLTFPSDVRIRIWYQDVDRLATRERNVVALQSCENLLDVALTLLLSLASGSRRASAYNLLNTGTSENRTIALESGVLLNMASEPHSAPKPGDPRSLASESTLALLVRARGGDASALDPFGEVVESKLAQQLIQSSVERVTRRRREIRRGDPHRWLPLTRSFAHRHSAL